MVKDDMKYSCGESEREYIQKQIYLNPTCIRLVSNYRIIELLTISINY